MYFRFDFFKSSISWKIAYVASFPNGLQIESINGRIEFVAAALQIDRRQNFLRMRNAARNKLMNVFAVCRAIRTIAMPRSFDQLKMI